MRVVRGKAFRKRPRKEMDINDDLAEFIVMFSKIEHIVEHMVKLVNETVNTKAEIKENVRELKNHLIKTNRKLSGVTECVRTMEKSTRRQIKTVQTKTIGTQTEDKNTNEQNKKQEIISCLDSEQ